ncbi:DUF222 domain-containing protein [Modestobacter sp. SYSU DS0875]
MFERIVQPAPFGDAELRAAMDELTERWRAEALGGETPRWQTAAGRLSASFEAGGYHLAGVRAAQAAIGAHEARRARAIAAFCRSRPSSLDRPENEIGAAAAATRAARPSALAPVSEWAVDEVAVALSLTDAAATRVVVQSLQLVERLPGTLRALERGALTWDHARVMSELVAPLDEEVRATAEERLLGRLGSKTPAQLRVAAHRVVARLDAAAVARRIAAAIRDRHVAVHPGADGMGTLSATLPLPVLRAVQNALEQYADAAAVPGDERTRAQRMADCLVDLVLRPGEHGLAPVQAQLTVVAGAGTLLGTDDEPGEVDGDLVPAEMVRRLAQALGLMPADGAAAPGSPDPDSPGTDCSGTDCSGTPPDVADPVAGAALADLVGTRTVAGTALAARPGIALVDELTGQLLALTDAAGLRAGRALGPPPESPGYSPGRALDRFVRLRDRRCRFPGCRKRPIRCDLDHTVPFPFGPTAHDNLCCLCRHHHRLSHQAPGWRLRGLPDGGLEWTTPTGQVLVTHPPRFGADDDLPPPDVDLPGPPRSRPPHDDPPPGERAPDPPDEPPPF